MGLLTGVLVSRVGDSSPVQCEGCELPAKASYVWLSAALTTIE